MDEENGSKKKLNDKMKIAKDIYIDIFLNDGDSSF